MINYSMTSVYDIGLAGICWPVLAQLIHQQNLELCVRLLSPRFSHARIINVFPHFRGTNVPVIDHNNKQPRAQFCSLGNSCRD